MAFVKRHPVVTFSALTFAISWGGMLLVLAGRTGLLATTEQAARLRPAVALVTVAGPTVASLLLTGLVGGRGGYRQLLSRLLSWRVGARWYAVALLTGSLLPAATLSALSLISPVFLPRIVTADDKASLLLVSLAAGLAGPVFEELGWTGFAIPRLRRGYGVLATGLIVGVLWGVWHVPSQVWYSGDASGALSLGILLPELVFALAVLPGYRVLML
jgi:membrane protease YdiL (CAAX protease family)